MASKFELTKRKDLGDLRRTRIGWGQVAHLRKNVRAEFTRLNSTLEVKLTYMCIASAWYAVKD